jgi:hypothetical protein
MNGAMKKSLISFGLVFAAWQAWGEGGDQARVPRVGWSPYVRGGSVYQVERDLKDEGRFSVNRYYVDGGLAYLFGPGRIAALSVGFGQDDYAFSGMAAEPWNNIDAFDVGGMVQWAYGTGWSLFLTGGATAYAETGAQHSDAWSGGVISAVSYRFSDDLKIGPGVGVIGQIEDDTRLFPILLIDWNIAERWNLSTGGGFAASQGPGLTLSYRPAERWMIGIAGRYEDRRFRLKDGGVGEDRSFPLAGMLTYAPNPGMQFALLAGYSFSGELRQEDAAGRVVAVVDYGAAPFLGGVLSLRF